jgi:hypothetical protein
MNRDLMIHVERIVRPVRAGGKRKLRMRRELLAHLEAAMEEELPLCPDQSAAIARALARLGNQAEITAQLQESVPRFERLMNAPLPESCLGTIGRMRITLLFGMLMIAGLSLLATLGLVFELAGLDHVLRDSGLLVSLLGLNIYAACMQLGLVRADRAHG